MKKLVLLLLIPMFFACSSDDDNGKWETYVDNLEESAPCLVKYIKPKFPKKTEAEIEELILSGRTAFFCEQPVSGDDQVVSYISSTWCDISEEVAKRIVADDTAMMKQLYDKGEIDCIVTYKYRKGAN